MLEPQLGQQPGQATGPGAGTAAGIAARIAAGAGARIAAGTAAGTSAGTNPGNSMHSGSGGWNWTLESAEEDVFEPAGPEQVSSAVASSETERTQTASAGASAFTSAELEMSTVAAAGQTCSCFRPSVIVFGSSSLIRRRRVPISRSPNVHGAGMLPHTDGLLRSGG